MFGMSYRQLTFYSVVSFPKPNEFVLIICSDYFVVISKKLIFYGNGNNLILCYKAVLILTIIVNE